MAFFLDNGIVQGNIIKLGSFESEKEWNDTVCRPA